jgi:hypothetical protein
MERIVLLSFVGVFSSMLSSATAWGQLITSDDFNSPQMISDYWKRVKKE